jgi:L-fuconolactonase
MIIDAHHHLWHYNKREYGWMDDSMTVLKRDYLPEDLAAEIGKAGVGGTVAVQARQAIEETQWLLEMAGRHSFIRGVVGWLDLRSPGLPGQLEQYGNHPKLVGVRHVIQDEPDEDFMLREDFLRGIAMLHSCDLAYDLLIFPQQLRNAVKLAAMFPEQRFVLDHISKPSIRTGDLQPWKDDIGDLAALPNVWCKISGMVTEADPRAWKYEDFVPYMKVVLDAFGSDRIMLGSDWPVCRLAGEYEVVMGIPMVYTRTLPEKEKQKILYQNAATCYKLDLS